MKLLIIFVILFLPFFSFAGLNGKFQGQGKAVFSSGKTYACKEIFLQLIQTFDQLSIPAGGYICTGGLHAGFEPFNLKISGGHLYYGDEQVGTITDDSVNISVYDPNDDSTYNLQLRKTSENNLIYDEQWFDGIELALRVTGELKKAGN